MIMFHVLLVFGLLTACYPLSDVEWEKWKKDHGKEYNDENSETNRRQIWSTNYKLIEEHNNADHSFKLALNHFADLVSYY